VKRGRSLVILAGLAALVGLLVWWDQRRPSTDERQRERQQLLPGFDRARATEIEIDRRGAVTRLRHEASGWWLVGPPRRRADDAAVESLLAALEYGSVERRVAGMHVDPRVTVRVAGHTLRIGGDSPTRGVYVQRDDEPDAVVADHRLVETADLDPRLWMSLRLTLRDPNEARSITLGDVTLSREHGWRITRPVDAGARANDAAVDALVQSLVRSRGEVAEPQGTIGSAGFAVALDGEKQVTLWGAGEHAIRADGATLRFRKTDLNAVYAPIEHYYERRLFPLRADDLVAVDVGPLQLRREAGAWRVIAPLSAVGPARDEAVRAFVEPLLAAQARDFTPAPPAAGTRVRLATRDDEVVATIDGTRARRSGDAVTLELGTPPDVALDVKRLRGPADLGTTSF
jgi:uncharacterized protein DUF4340